MYVRLLAAILLSSLDSSAQPSGSFAATGHMTVARAGHTATLLTNGTVLVAGGYQYQGSMVVGLKSAEIYHPSSGAFSPTGDMSVPRSRHTATVLPDGRVLIVGGNSADIYDPATGTFTPAGKMNTGVKVATLLNSGKVLLVGDATHDSSSCSKAAELYDPATDTFQLTGNMTSGRCTPRLPVLADGRVLVVPGDEGDDPGIAGIYDPETGSFMAANWQNIDIIATSNLLVNGNVLVSLAAQECDFLSTNAAVYAPTSGLRTTGKMASGICRPTGTLLSDGSVLIAGGWFAGTVAQVYDPASGSFSPAANMTTYRQEYAATLLNDGTVLMTGGDHPAGSPLDLSSYGFATSDTAELYQPGSVRSVPALLSLGNSEQGAVLHTGTSRVVSAGDPASAGEAIEIFGTGLISGGAVPPQVAVGGRLAEVMYFGNAPGYSALSQINVRVPNGIKPGPAVPVRLHYLSRFSNEVTIAVQ